MVFFPEKIRIRVIDSYTHESISNIVVSIKLFANHKSDYVFILPISDKSGIIEFTRKWLNEEIQKERNLFIMDYSSDLDDCRSKIELRILDVESLKKAINAMNMYKNALGISQKEIDKISNAINGEYYSETKEVELRDENSIDIELLTKRF